MRRRTFTKLALGASAATAMAGCRSEAAAPAGKRDHRVFVLAFDGLDPKIVRGLIDGGRMPNLARLAKSGSLASMATSTPPHTPVAFSNIISGADPGLHHVFDFIQRDPRPADESLAVRPYFGSAEAEVPENVWALSLGKWQLPLSGGQTKLLRRGPAFWDALIAAGIDTDIYYLPSNYPPPQPTGPGRFRCISGMGTPDLLGDYGTFTCFTPDTAVGGREVGGGRFVFLNMVQNYAETELVGPANPLRAEADNGAPPMKARLYLARDPFAPVARISINGQTHILNEGEWSPWTTVVFETGIPGSPVLQTMGAPTSMLGMVRFFVKQVHPKFELYVSPINIDPLAPLSPISSPASLSRDLARKHGRFYTTGIPEDTKALSHGALSERQFLHQSDLSMQERIEQYRNGLAQFESGCFFFYFGATDLVQHMFWRDRDPQHPGRVPEQAEQFESVVEDIYAEIDELVGDTLAAAVDGDTVIVFSDHGFNSFRQGFNLNTWLAQNGFLAHSPSPGSEALPLFPGVDWSRTRAYGLGMNALYLNLAGREKHGVVRPEQRVSLLNEIRDKLMTVRDEAGNRVIREILLGDTIYPAADRDVCPDMFIGYEEGFRASWDTVLGGLPGETLALNLERWSGTHLIAAELVPGVLISNRHVTVVNPDIRDLAPTILQEFGLQPMDHMTGRALFSSTP